MPELRLGDQMRLLEDARQLQGASLVKLATAGAGQRRYTAQVHAENCNRGHLCRAGTASPVLYGYSTPDLQMRGKAPASADGCEGSNHIMHPHGVSVDSCECIGNSTGTGHVGPATRCGSLRILDYNSTVVPTGTATVYPLVDQRLLHERVQTDLRRLLQDLLQSPVGRIDLQRALHAGVERGLFRKISCAPGRTATDPDEALLRGFWAAHSRGQYCETPATGLSQIQSPQQVWRQFHSGDTRHVAPQDQAGTSAHVRAHNRPEVLHICRLLGSKGELVHVPYAPYRQNITRESAHALKRQ